MIIKRTSDHVVKQTVCGEIHEVLFGGEYAPLGIAIAPDIKETSAHFHQGFEEIYFVLDGSLMLRLYDPKIDASWDERLNANELCVISLGVHHKIVESSRSNRLCVISVPQFDPNDEFISDKI